MKLNCVPVRKKNKLTSWGLTAFDDVEIPCSSCYHGSRKAISLAFEIQINKKIDRKKESRSSAADYLIYYYLIAFNFNI